ncbi:MAG: GNAT family N-acetyltransferase [Cyclobacteriaceae bacterium]|jgi:RimJ/RimL family protein N-acetyltransferase
MVDPKHFHLTVDGRKFHFRSIDPTDKELLQRGFSQLSERSKYFRFFAVHSMLTDYELKFFTELDGFNHVAWGILDESANDIIPVGIGRFVRIKDDPEIAEVAYTVIDSYQGKGLGHYLFAILNIIASRLRIEKFRYFVLADNTKALNMLYQLGIISIVRNENIKIVETTVFEDHKSIPQIPELRKVRSVMKQVEKYIYLSK